MQQLFITVAYYIGDSENIEQMQNELCILLLDTEHSGIRGYGLYKKISLSDKYYKQVHLLHQQAFIFLLLFIASSWKMNYFKFLLFDFIARDVVIFYKIQINSFT